jgi:hypothetical protein
MRFNCSSTASCFDRASFDERQLIPIDIDKLSFKLLHSPAEVRVRESLVILNVPGFNELVHVELPEEGCEVVMLKVV